MNADGKLERALSEKKGLIGIELHLRKKDTLLELALFELDLGLPVHKAEGCPVQTVSNSVEESYN